MATQMKIESAFLLIARRNISVRLANNQINTRAPLKFDTLGAQAMTRILHVPRIKVCFKTL